MGADLACVRYSHRTGRVNAGRTSRTQPLLLSATTEATAPTPARRVVTGVALMSDV